MTNPAPTSGEKFGVKFNVSQDIFDESVIYKNVRQEFVVTTSDKLKLNLIEYQKAIGARKDWLTPFGVFLSLLLTITTAEFKDTLNIGKETWKAFFFILLIASVLWLVYSLICWFKFRHQGNIDTFIKNITESKQSPQAAASETTKAPDVQNQN